MDYLLPKIKHRGTTTLISRLLFLGCLFFSSMHALATQEPIIISSANSNYHKSLVQSILSNLKESDVKPKTLNTDQPLNFDITNDLIISIGNDAASLLNQKSSTFPQLRVITQITLENEHEDKNVLYLSTTQPACRQFELIRLFNAKWKTVSVLLASPNALLTQKLESCAAENTLTLNTIIIGEYLNIIDALNTSLIKTDVLLALPDPSVYNARTIKSILLTTYRHRVPVIGFSESFVRAGALTAIHSSTKQLAKQIAELIIKHYNNQETDKHHHYPEYFDITINKDVAKSLGINIPDRMVLTEKLKNHE